MPRPLRVGDDGSILHVGARGNRKQLIFLDSSDRELFLELLARTVARFGWLLHCYCLMGNHFHLAVETPVFNLSEGMQLLMGRYAQLFNERRGHSGHLFEGRFWSEAIRTDAHLLETLRYIVMNPVRAGLVGHPGEWHWSSYAATAGLEPPPPFLCVARARKWFHEDERRGCEAFRRFVEDSVVPALSGV